MARAAPQPGPEQILATYERVCTTFAEERDQSLFERGWLDRALAGMTKPTILDLGCGPGVPIARYLVDRGALLTGVDGAPGMIELFRERVPEARAIVADMRGIQLGAAFDLVIAWNSFFHLSCGDQLQMFDVFDRYVGPTGRLLFTSGPKNSEVWGIAGGEPVYHASACPDEYRSALAEHEFEVEAHVTNDPSCHGHTVWLARRCGNRRPK